MRTFIVGDVHGCFKELMSLLDKADYKPKRDKLILIGDLINKGPDSFKVLSWVRAKNIPSVLGNHEFKFIEGVEKNLSLPAPLRELKKQMGSDLDSWLAWIKKWPIYIETKNFLVVHGGLIPGEHPSQSKKQYLLNIRYWGGDGHSMQKEKCLPAWHDLYTHSKLVVYGHWAKQGLKIKPNSIGLDTGCVYGGLLTGLWLPEKQIVQVRGWKPFLDKSLPSGSDTIYEKI